MHPDRTQQSSASREDGFLLFLLPLIWSRTCTCCCRRRVTATCFPVHRASPCHPTRFGWSSSVHSHVLSRFLQDQHQSLKEIPSISSLVTDYFTYAWQFSLFMTPNYPLASLTETSVLCMSFHLTVPFLGLSPEETVRVVFKSLVSALIIRTKSFN